ncbi:hypothetical protein [Hyphomicrobium methylovorum]|uniref:hypothetical protein n=1 Tax=Hyphomicrobium methylovorum TaxID=84 RepID=UPI0015E6764E|nr:hypothetical protein [Hyphomicrobium methylovorum]
MLRHISVSHLAACAFLALATCGAAADGYTTRIETRPIYGAVVTVEEGVRVFRPLPPDRQVIINPNRTPLSLGFNETHVYGSSPSRVRVYTRRGATYSEDGTIYSAPLYGRGFRHGHGGPGHPGGPHHSGPRQGGGGVQMR